MPQFNVSDYIDTQERINRFWAERNAAEEVGFITTELLSDPDIDTYVTIKATVGYYLPNGNTPVVLATGLASETRAYAAERNQPGHNRVNETSWVENCETSAIGRAFANLGYATTGADRPSRQEMEKVNNYEAATEGVRPSAPATPRPAQPRPSGGGYGGGGYNQPAPRAVQNPGAAPTERQIETIMKLARGNHEMMAMAMFEAEFSQINRQQASDMIKELMEAIDREKAAKQAQPEVEVIDEHEF